MGLALPALPDHEGGDPDDQVNGDEDPICNMDSETTVIGPDCRRKYIYFEVGWPFIVVSIESDIWTTHTTE